MSAMAMHEDEPEPDPTRNISRPTVNKRGHSHIGHAHNDHAAGSDAIHNIAKFHRKVFQVEVTEDGKSIVPPSDWVEAKHKHESFYGF